MKKNYGISAFITAIFLLFFSQSAISQIIKGTITDGSSGEPLVGAAVIIKGTTTGAQTDFDGKFSFEANQQPPFTLVVSFLGYDNTEIQVTSFDAIKSGLKVKLSASSVRIEGVEVVDTRITEKQKESALTVETMGIIAIKETPAANFYEGLGALKGVDVTASSLSFKVINTRGFNSTSPVRSLQIIDGVDNQSPGLNFSLGNFLGASELDVQKVDLIVGASSAYYGPNAFNGVIAMQTKSPFIHKGLSVSLKGGERALFEGGFRWAHPIQNKKGEDKFAYKLNFFFLRANDWVADNMDPATDSRVGRDNPGGYDAVNVYGDEDLAGGNDFTSLGGQIDYPGLGIFYRSGYQERDLVNYNTRNYKASGSLHYKINKDIEAILSSSFASGTTVYQGENRYNLRGILFFQNRFEIKQEGKFFVRFYATNEDGGDSFDAVVTAFRLNEASKKATDWNNTYSSYYLQQYRNKIRQFGDSNGTIQQMWANTGFPNFVPYDTVRANSILAAHRDSIVKYHNDTRNFVNTVGNVFQNPFYEPGTARFDSLYNIITKTNFNEGGSRFYDKSALYHLHGEYKVSPKAWAELTFGANGRLYVPNSRGTIFQDTMKYRFENRNIDSVTTVRDTIEEGYNKIKNFEFGVYTGIEKKFFANKLKANFAIRMDKNMNFKFLFSPALSVVYSPTVDHTVRLSFSSAIRNPTLADQYLYYDVGRAILLGNLEGYTNLVTIPSFRDYLNSRNTDTLQYFNVQPIRPEVCRSVEVGYRTTLFKHIYIDASYYFSFYKYFIGYKLGIDLEYDSLTKFPLAVQAYRVATNSEDLVTTQGFSAAISYFFKKHYTLSGNYSWNVIDLRGADKEIIPAFNTPAHKFNLGFSGRDIPIKSVKHWGFSANYKWVQGFTFQGSPQFTGDIPSYGMLDVQINKAVPKIYCTFKVGASNVLNNKVYLVYGGPRVGRLAYFSILFEFDKI
jgi:iron complex outermembrane recepter protein